LGSEEEELSGKNKTSAADTELSARLEDARCRVQDTRQLGETMIRKKRGGGCESPE